MIVLSDLSARITPVLAVSGPLWTGAQYRVPLLRDVFEDRTMLDLQFLACEPGRVVQKWLQLACFECALAELCRECLSAECRADAFGFTLARTQGCQARADKQHGQQVDDHAK